MTECSNLPISAGLRVTLMPQASMTASFSCAVPLPPETIAPAWHMLFHPFRSVLFVAAADFADHDHGIGLGIIVEKLQHVDVLEAVDRVAADAHCGGLAHPELGQLRDRLVGEGS